MIEPCRFGCGTEIDYETRTFSDGLSIIIPWETNGVRGYPPAIFGHKEKTPTYETLHNCPKLVVLDIRKFTPEMLIQEDERINSWKNYTIIQDLHVDAPNKLEEYVQFILEHVPDIFGDDTTARALWEKEMKEYWQAQLSRLKQMSIEERFTEHYNGMLWEVANSLSGIEYNERRKGMKELLIRCLHLFPDFFLRFSIFDNSAILDPPEDFDQGWIPPDFGSDGLLPYFRLEPDRVWHPLELLAFFYKLDGSIDDTLQCLDLQWYIDSTGDANYRKRLNDEIFEIQTDIQSSDMEQQESRAKQLDKYKPQLKRFAKFGLDIENLAVGITEEVIDPIIKDFERNALRPFVLKYFPTPRDQIKKLKSMSWIQGQTILDKAQHREKADKKQYLQDPNATLLNFVDVKDLRAMVWGSDDEHKKIPDWLFHSLTEIINFRNKGAPHPQNYPAEKEGLANLLILIKVMQCQEYFQEMGPQAGLE